MSDGSAAVAAVEEGNKPSSVNDPAQIAENWAQWTTDEGYPYFHNSVTGETVWEEPEALQRAKEVAKAEAAVLEEDEWAAAAKRDEDRKTRRAARLKAEAERAAAKAAAEIVAEASTGGIGEKPVSADRQEEQSAATLMNADIDAELGRVEVLRLAIAFQEALMDAGIRSFSSWESVLPRLAVDARFTSIPDMAMRRRLFDWWCRQRAGDAEAVASEAAATHQQALAQAATRWEAELIAAASSGRLAIPAMTFEAFKDAAAAADARTAASLIGSVESRRLFDKHRSEAVAKAERNRSAVDAEAKARALELRENGKTAARAALQAALPELRWLRRMVTETFRGGRHGHDSAMAGEGVELPSWRACRWLCEDGREDTDGRADFEAGAKPALNSAPAMGGGVLRGRAAMDAASASASASATNGRGGTALVAASRAEPPRGSSGGAIGRGQPLCRDSRWNGFLSDSEMAQTFADTVKLMSDKVAAEVRASDAQQRKPFSSAVGDGSDDDPSGSVSAATSRRTQVQQWNSKDVDYHSAGRASDSARRVERTSSRRRTRRSRSWSDEEHSDSERRGERHRGRPRKDRSGRQDDNDEDEDGEVLFERPRHPPRLDEDRLQSKSKS